MIWWYGAISPFWHCKTSEAITLFVGRLTELQFLHLTYPPRWSTNVGIESGALRHDQSYAVFNLGN